MRLGALWLMGLGLAAVACGKSSGGEDPSTGVPQDLAASSTSADGLTPDEATTALNLIDDHCGDAWCESDLDYSFDKLACTFATGECTLNFVAIDKDNQTRHPLSCNLTGLKKFDDLVVTFPQTGFKDLVGSFLGQVDTCVTDKSTGL